MQTQLIQQLNHTLKQFEIYWNGEELQRNVVIEAIRNKNPKLIKALLNNEKIKEQYVTVIDGVTLFDYENLISLLKYKEYWHDSFTKYRNSVGLTSEGKYLNYNSDVVLDFPFKDCVLEGGMTKEEQGQDEVYYNEVIARDEIDRLFSPKVFTNIKRYSKDGIEEDITNFNDNNNLIIKGNNLIALHSLKQRYVGKVKLIYIDPPYNTGNDGFKYNDRFNHSTWLTFMKNRLEIARELLSDDGVIFVQINNTEFAYLKVLMDSVFYKNNFLDKLLPIMNPRGNQANKYIATCHEYIFIYAKDIDKVKLRGIDLTSEQIKEYNKSDDNGFYREIGLRKRGAGSLREDAPNQYFPIYYNENNETLSTKIKNDGDIEIYPKLSNGLDGRWRWSFKTVEENKDKLIVRKVNRNGNQEYDVFEKDYLTETKTSKIKTVLDKNVNNELGTRHIKDLALSFNNPKPEQLLKTILSLSTNENDLVLDFHLGSGTTAAVAHKMNRRYIGIEQMDYINEVTVPRLEKVIDGEQGGISKDVNWQGGGSFVYAELKEFNQQYISQVNQAESYQQLEVIFENMKNNAHLNYQVELDKILKTAYEVDGIFRLVSFNELDLHKQKELLIELLDKNQLYVNADDMNDQNLKVSAQEKAFTNSFYAKD